MVGADDLAVGVDEAAFDERFDGPRAHHPRVGPSAAQQIERVDEQRLAGARLTRQGGQTGAEVQVDSLRLVAEAPTGRRNRLGTVIVSMVEQPEETQHQPAGVDGDES